MEQGFIKLHRSILDWEWWSDNNTLKVFLYLLLNANWEDSRYRGYDVPRGSLVTGINSLSENLKISERSVRTALKHLKSTGEVTIKSTNKFSIVSIVNWEKYQGFSENATSKVTSEVSDNRQASDRQVTTYKEIKNIRSKEEKNYRPQSFNANKGMLTSYTPELFAELERETRYKDG